MTDIAAEVPEQPAPADRIAPTPWATTNPTAVPGIADPPTAILSAVVPDTVHPESTEPETAHAETAHAETTDPETEEADSEEADSEEAEATHAVAEDAENEDAENGDGDGEEPETEEPETAHAETEEAVTADYETADPDTEDLETEDPETEEPETEEPKTAYAQTEEAETADPATTAPDETPAPAAGQSVPDGAAETVSAAAQPTEEANVPTDTIITPLSNNATAHASRGRTTVADEVVEKVAGIAAREVPGVFDLGGDVARAVTAVRERIHLGQESAAQGVSVKLEDKTAEVDVVIVIEFGFQVYDVADAVRDKVISSVEQMLGINVTAVNVRVDDVHIPDHESAGGKTGLAKD